MRRIVVVGVMGWSLVAGAQAQADAPSVEARQWNELLVGKRNVAGAKALCSGWEATGTGAEKLEAEKCLTAVVLQGAPPYTAKAAQQGLPKYPAAVADEALRHIDRALGMTPDDLKLNLGKLFVLAEAHRYEALAGAFEEALKRLPGEEMMPEWQQAMGEMVADGVPRGALVLAEVLYKHFPESHEAAGNVGSLHDLLKEWDQGLPFLRKAVELAPTDAIDTWNLGWSLDHLGKDDEANQWMGASLKLPSDAGSLKERRCLYGEFLIVKRKQTAQGCALVKSSCGMKVAPPMCVVGAAKKAVR